ncbi:MAG TPA: acyltransferase [Tepidisphaeraceae bacterium]|nr:acyltransferase [Tepidisphaeraceae bacterium]
MTDTFAARCQPGRFNNFDALRLLLALSVIYGHSYALTQGNLEAEAIYRFTHGLFYSGTFAVAFFFLISGFLITGSWLKSPTLLAYCEKRFLRIAPGYIAAVLFSVLVVATLTSGVGAYQGRLLLQSAVIAPMNSLRIFPNNPYPRYLNGSLWTIRYEVLCYGLVALLGLAKLISRRGAVLAVTILLILTAAVDTKMPFLDRLPAGFGMSNIAMFYLACFGVGMVFYLHAGRIPYSPWNAGLCVVLMTVVCHGEHREAISILLFPFPLGYVLFYIAFSSFRIPAWKGVDLSYGTYVYAFVAQQFLAWRGVRNIGLMLGLAIAITIPLAICSWFLVERPALRLKRRIAKPAPAKDLEAAGTVAHTAGPFPG